MKSNREYRTLRKFETSEDSMIVKGYASTFNEAYTLWGDDEIEVREIIDSRAFDNCDMEDVIFQYNHAGRVFARKRNNTLTVEPTDEGLYIEADLGGTTEGRNLYEEIKGGYTDRMSFGFIIRKMEDHRTYEGEKLVYTQRITEISKLFDVSAVSLPANEGTSISARSLDGVIEELKTERSKQKEKERRDSERRNRIRKMIEKEFN